MKIIELTESAIKQKAGVIPFIVLPDGSVKMMFMSPSDPSYGGPRPQIAKGGVDQGESIKEAAIREGEEELGLNRSNIIAIYAVPPVTLSGLDATYTMSIFAVQVKDHKNFGMPHFETGATYWLTDEQFALRGRKTQQQLVDAAAAVIAKHQSPT